ncbi:NTP transferase domain-containing protein [Candidatus Sumerlaeota bacterium]|nr:NTP transferase domain-containing protein [Candidatus Sumerlaeota bacterium]
MRAIIPTAGVGKRLQPFTHTVPKVLLQVADRPIVGHIIEKVVAQGIRDITFIVGHLGDRIQRYVTRRYPQVNASFVEQAEPLGLGHAVYLGRDLQRDESEPLLVILGDSIIDADLETLAQSEGTDLIGVLEVDNPRRFGVVELDGEFISRMVEKPEHPKTNLAVVGIYYFNHPSILFETLEANIAQGIKTCDEIQLTDALQGMIEKGVRMRLLKVHSWLDCGTPETLLSTNHELLRRRFMDAAFPAARFENVAITPPVCISETARVKDSLIGPDVTIAGDAVVSGSIIRNTIVNEGAQVHNARLTDSIVGNHAVVRESALRLYVGDNSEIVFG